MYGYFILSAILEMKGKLPEALAADEEGARLGGPKIIAGRLLVLLGRRKEAYQLIAEAEKRGPKAFQCGIAGTYLALGEMDKGFALFKQAMDRREPCSLSDPRFDDFRSDPRFKALIAPPGLK